MGDIFWGLQYSVLVVMSLWFGRSGTLGAMTGMLIFLAVDRML